MISRSRGYLPHLETNQSIYFVTFRLEDSLPSKLVLSWKQELQIKKRMSRNNESMLMLFKDEYEEKIQNYLDSGYRSLLAQRSSNRNNRLECIAIF
jgi:hypothetical protein